MGAPETIEITESTVTVTPGGEAVNGVLELVDDVADTGHGLFRKIVKIVLVLIVLAVVANVVKTLMEKNAAQSDEQPTFETKPVDTSTPDAESDDESDDDAGEEG